MMIALINLRAWQHITDCKFIFSQSLEWNRFVLSQLPLIAEAIEGESVAVDQEDWLYFSDAALCLALESDRALVGDEECRQLLETNQGYLDKFLLPPPNSNLSDNNNNLWSKLRLEHISRQYLYMGLFDLRQIEFPLSDSEDSRDSIRHALNNILLSLSRKPHYYNLIISTLIRLATGRSFEFDSKTES